MLAVNDAAQQFPTAVGSAIELRQLLAELIDAHVDTVELATRSATDVAWSAHIAYIRDLQRLAQETLARMDP
jgi:hypothetical protein